MTEDRSRATAPPRTTAAPHGWRERYIRGNPTVNLAYRAVVGVLGVLLIAVGVALLPLPGPGWLIIFAGLAVLASEFAWAARLLRYARAQVARWTAWAGRQPWWLRAVLGVGCLVLIAVIVVGALVLTGTPSWLEGPLHRLGL
jgi:uncharacterized protein (TIGR02611 family)